MNNSEEQKTGWPFGAFKRAVAPNQKEMSVFEDCILDCFVNTQNPLYCADSFKKESASQ